jgi:outer membrane immunogenic protein
MNCAYVKTLGVPLAAAFAFAALPAQAADTYALEAGAKDTPMYETIPNWTGFYLGVNSGYGWGALSSTLNTSATDASVLPAVVTAASSKLSAEGGFGGGQLGYNLQRDRIVFGVEADIQAGHIAGGAFSEANPEIVLVDTNAWAKSTLAWFGTLRGRAGYSFGSTLLYATGGIAFGGVRDSLAQTATSFNVGTPSITESDSVSKNTTATGWVAGGGVETALTPSWSVKAEYQYIDLGSTLLSTNRDFTYNCGVGDITCTDNGSASIKMGHTYHTVRLGVNYKVNQPYEPLR